MQRGGGARSSSSSGGGCLPHYSSARLPLPAFVTGIVILVVLLATWSFEVTNTVIPQHGLATFDFSEYISHSLASPLNSPRYSYETKPDSSSALPQVQLPPKQQPHQQPHQQHQDRPHGSGNEHHSGGGGGGGGGSSGHHHHQHHSHKRNLTRHWSGVLSLVIFVAAYVLVICEDRLQPYFRKSVPMTVAAGLIWAIVALQLGGGNGYVASIARHNLLEFGEVFLFLLVAMTYIATLEELNMFNVLRAYLVERQFSYAMMFWITGALAFVLSPLADNLTTALLMGAVLTNIGRDQEQFVSLGCINVVVAANAGGAFSPFGDITTLMMWQRGKLHITQFFLLIIPSIVNWLVPACIMVMYIPAGIPARVTGEHVQLHPGGITVALLFLFTISMTASFHSTFHLPPVLGMMTGLGVLQTYGFFALRQRKGYFGPDSEWVGGEASNGLKIDSKQAGASNKGKTSKRAIESASANKDHEKHDADEEKGTLHGEKAADRMHPLNIFRQLEKAEWDTLLFFYGVVMCVGALGLVGYLDSISQLAYQDLGPTVANVLVGLLSAVVDNIPVMYAVLSTDPTMSTNQWLLVTLTAGVGGSILSVGSAAGVGLMGQARGIYTFKEHMRWSWAVMLGYLASIAAHLIVNGT